MRLSGIVLVATMAPWLVLVAFGNITDYGSIWMSHRWNGLGSAFRFVVVLPLAPVRLGQRDDELDAP